MTGSARLTSPAVIFCCICAAPILLETSKTDERGEAVHEECYVRKTIRRFRTAVAVRSRQELAQFYPLQLQIRLQVRTIPNDEGMGTRPRD